jgi:hypothetical protein
MIRDTESQLRFVEKLRKAEDPVDLAIAALTPALEAYWDGIATDAMRELLVQVLDLPDDNFSGVPDPVSSDSAVEESKAAEDLALSLLASLRLRLSAPPPPGVLAAAGNLAKRLARAGARQAALRLDLSASGGISRIAEAAGDLAFTVRAHLTPERLEALKKHVQVLIRSRSTRQVPIRRTEWVEEARKLLGFPSAPWMTIGVEGWAVRWRSIGTLEGARQAGVTVLVAWNPLDHRTSSFCRWIYGRRLSVTRATEQVDRYLSAVRADDVLSAFEAWPLLRISPSMTEEDFEGLAASVGLPPYHAHCRTEARPV